MPSDSQWQAILNHVGAVEALSVDLPIHTVEVYLGKILQGAEGETKSYHVSFLKNGVKGRGCKEQKAITGKARGW